METAASRLETGRYAALAGATTEFRKMEGATFDPDRGQLYVAMSRIQRGMLDNDEKYDLGGSNDIRLADNGCGAVYALEIAAGQTDSDGAAIDSESVFTKMSSVVEGKLRDYDEPALAANKCDVDRIAEPDNLTYLPGSDMLIIAEDSGRHEIDVIWAYDVESGELTRIQTTPYAAETTGVYWYRDINGWGYLSSVIQTPFGDPEDMPEGEMERVSEDAKRAYVGVIGPLPALTN